MYVDRGDQILLAIQCILKSSNTQSRLFRNTNEKLTTAGCVKGGNESEEKWHCSYTLNLYGRWRLLSVPVLSVMWRHNHWLPLLSWHGMLVSSAAAARWTAARRWGQTTGLWLAPAPPASGTAAPRTPASGWAPSAPREAAALPGASHSPGRDGWTQWLWSRCWGRRQQTAGQTPATSSEWKWTCQPAEQPACWRPAKLAGGGTVQRWQSPATGPVPSGRTASLRIAGSLTRDGLTGYGRVTHWAVLVRGQSAPEWLWQWEVTDCAWAGMVRYCRDVPLHSWLHLQIHPEEEEAPGSDRKCSQSQPRWKAFLLYDKENIILDKMMQCAPSDGSDE